jgi:hypothetical protein
VGYGQGEHGVDRGRLDHWTKGLIVVDAGSLGEAPKNTTRLVPFQRTVRIELVLENPLVVDDVGANGVRDKIRSVVGDQCSKFFFHGMTPIQIDEVSLDGGGYRQQGRCRSGRQGESISRKQETLLVENPTSPA